MLKVFYAGIRKDQYDEHRRGFSFEYNNFYLTLAGMEGVQVTEIPYDSIVRAGRRTWNAELLDRVKNEKPDLLFIFPYTDELETKTLGELKRLTTTLAWFADDHWRLWNYSRHLAPHLSWAITTWSKAPEYYKKYGVKNVIRSQWACNPRVWYPVEAQKQDIEVSFVGQRNSAREKIVKKLREQGVPLWVRGWGWPEGRLSEEEMRESISRSQIALNVNNPPDRWRLKLLARLVLRKSVTKIVPDLPHFFGNVRSWMAMDIPQIKARPFELAGSGAFVISGYADDLGRYYERDKEMVFYENLADLLEKVKYYLAHPEERKRIAAAGYARTMKEHTYEARFEEIFAKLGFRV